MSEVDDVSGLEKALMERARKLSEEHLVNGRQARDLILLETRQRLRLKEERETPPPRRRVNVSTSNARRLWSLSLRARTRPPALGLTNDMLDEAAARACPYWLRTSQGTYL